MSDGFLGVPPQILAGVPAWRANTTYQAGQLVISPGGDPVTAKNPFTSAATYNPANWNPSTQDGRISGLEGLRAFPLIVAPSNSDANEYRSRGHHLIASTTVAATITNLPVQAAGIIETESTTAGLIFQTYRAYGTTGGVWVRRSSATSPTPLPYTAWKKIDADPTSLAYTTLTGSEDFNNLRTPGKYLVNSSTLAGTILNVPGNLRAGVLNVDATGGGAIFQTYQEYAGSMYYRATSASSPTPLPYTPWVDLSGGDATSTSLRNVGMTNGALVDAFVAARGGTIGTGGKASIAFRYDHGLANFRDLILPLHEARNIPCGQAINTANWSASENAGVTPSVFNGWVVNSGVQPLAHSHTHGPASTDAEIIAEVDNQMPLLAADFPEVVCEYFAPPGVSAAAPANWQGWTAADTVKHFTNDYVAAKAVMRRFAVTSGYLDGVYRPQSGRVRQGLSHMTMDGLTTFADCQSVIDTAIDNGAALQVMIHPSLVNTAGYITDSIIGQMLDYVLQKRDSGALSILSPAGLVLADDSHTRRHDLLVYGNFADITKWNATGYTFAGNVATSTDTAGVMSRSVSLSNFRYARGRHREFAADFTATTGAVVRLLVESATGGLSVSKDFTLPASPDPVRKSVIALMPLTASAVTVRLGRVSGGAITVSNAGVYAL